MMKRILARLDSVYRDSSVVVRAKAPVVFLVVSIISLLLLVVLAGDVLQRDYLNAAIEGVIFLSLTGSVWALFRGHFRAASITPIVMSAIAVTGLAFVAPPESGYQVYTITAYMVPPLLLSTSVAHSKWYTIAVVATGFSTILSFALVRLLPVLDAAAASELTSGRLVPALGIYLMSGIMAIILTARTNSALRSVEAAARQSSDTLQRVVQVSESASSSLSSQREVETNYTHVQKSVQLIRDQISVLDANIGSLQSAVSAALSSVHATAERVAGFHNQVDEQNTVVQESTAAVNEISASLDSVAQITSSRKQSSDRLIGVVTEGMAALEVTNTAFVAATDRMNSLLEINGIVSGIAEETNVLSMNAAIEAAHAGDSGRGFAVVAAEIRKLANTTTEHSQMISATLKKLMESMSQTSSSVEQTKSSMEAVAREVHEVSRAFDEITGSTAELSHGGREIMNAMQVLQETSVQVRDGSDEIDRDQQAARQEIDAIGDFVDRMTTVAEEVSRAATTIDDAMRILHRTIEESGIRSTQVHESIASLVGTMGEHTDSRAGVHVP